MPPRPLRVIPRLSALQALPPLPRATGRLAKMTPDLSRAPRGRMRDLGDGVVSRVYDTGETELQPVILLHGMSATGMLNWYQTFQRLQGEYRLVAPDLRWHGRGHQSSEFRFADLADDAFRLADTLELERPVLGGYSMGGIVTQLAARRDPSRWGGLVLAATGTGAERNAMERLTMGTFLRSSPLVNIVPTELAGAPDDSEDAYDRVYRWALRELASIALSTHRRVIAEVARFNSTAWLHELTLPVAVVKTLHDVAFTQKVQDEMVDLLPHSAVFPIDAGHAVCATHPGTFARRMRTAISWVVSNGHGHTPAAQA